MNSIVVFFDCIFNFVISTNTTGMSHLKVMMPISPTHSVDTRILKLTTSQHLVLRLIIRETFTPPHHTPSWCGV